MKNYRKCEFCNELTIIIDESTNKCSKCHMKFENLYDEWKIKNPNNSYEDYLSEVCISEKKATRLLKRRSIYILIIPLILYSLFDVLNYISKQVSNKTEITEKKWIKQSFEDSEITIKIPYKLKQIDYSVNDDSKQYIESINSYNYTLESGFAITLQCTNFKSLNADSNLNKLMLNTFDNFKNTEVISKVKSSLDSVYNGKIKGYLISGSFIKENIEITFETVLFGKKKKLLQLFFLYQKGDNIARKTTAKIIETIEIKQD